MKTLILMSIIGLYSCINSVTSIDDKSKIQEKNKITGTWEIRSINHLKIFDIKRETENVSFFGAEVWGTSEGKKFIFKENQTVETDIFNHNNKPITLYYKYNGKEKLKFFFGSLDSEKSFYANVKLYEESLSLIMDDYLMVDLVKLN